MQGERQIAEQIESQMRRTLQEYESQLDKENNHRSIMESDINRSTELARSFRDELENISLGANRKQQLVEDLNLKLLSYSRDKTLMQTQLKSLETKLENMEKHNELILRQRNEPTKLLLSQTSEFNFSTKHLVQTT